ncbi:MAG: type II toxin-antitoxin system VapC family toxin [Solirubrobacterales bacterium]|nr:type II toxin-antitoxin system VapC family toxin [Solirubrobacterales bacterium]
MTYLPDVNVVVASHRRDHPQNESAREWLDRTVESKQAFGIPTLVWGSFLRLASDWRVFPIPRSRDELFAFIGSVRGQDAYLPVEPGPRHIEILREICDEGDARANLVPDAVLAAVALENSCEIVTFDRDFARFPSVRHTLLVS